ncbi:MAG: ISNCY family transposase [Bacteroidetes bacterium]|nr:MAG: ISNCY family transposase [Bacteroidota bacterium]
MQFEEIYGNWQSKRLTQDEAARLLGMSTRTFRRYVDRYEHSGAEGLIDKRLGRESHRRAPVHEVMELLDKYKDNHRGWNAKHFYSWYRRDGGKRSYTWVKCRLQEAGLIAKAPGKGKHRKRRARAPWPGMLIHQDGSPHQWVAGLQWDLIITLDDATNEHYSMFFVQEEGTASSFQATKEVIEKRGLFLSLYTDRGSHYWYTPRAGGKVDKTKLTQFGRAMKQLNISMIAAYSPEARGRCERMFKTHQERLPKELAMHEITSMEAANRYLQEVYLPAFNKEFAKPSPEQGSAFVPYVGPDLGDILCEQHERTVNKDNCVLFEGLKLQIPADKYRMHYVKVRVRVHRYPDGTLAVFHGPRRLASFHGDGSPWVGKGVCPSVA